MLNEKRLIKKLKMRDENALVSFIGAYGGLMKSVIYPYFPDSLEDREEVLNDAVLKVWQNITYYDSSRSSFKNWCAAVAKYRAIDYLRCHHKLENDTFEEAYTNTQSADNGDLNERLEAFLSALSEVDRLIFTSIYLEGESTKDVAKKLSLTDNAIYKRVQKARKKAKSFSYEKEEMQ